MAKEILLADDSVTIQKVVELTFMDEDYRVTAVSNGDEAVARLAQASDPPNLVIADVHMPGLNGYQVCRQVKGARPGTPVLLLVGTFEPFSKEEYAACGADGYLKKPFDSQELLRQVEELLRPAAAPAPAAAAGAVDLEPDAVWGNVDDQLVAAVAGEAGTAAVAPAAEDMEETVSEAPKQTAPAGGEPAAALSDQDVDRIARRVVEILSEKVVREVSWEVIPDLAEVIIKDRLRELESQVE